MLKLRTRPLRSREVRINKASAVAGLPQNIWSVMANISSCCPLPRSWLTEIFQRHALCTHLACRVNGDCLGTVQVHDPATPHDRAQPIYVFTPSARIHCLAKTLGFPLMAIITRNLLHIHVYRSNRRRTTFGARSVPKSWYGQ